VFQTIWLCFTDGIFPSKKLLIYHTFIIAGKLSQMEEQHKIEPAN